MTGRHEPGCQVVASDKQAYEKATQTVNYLYNYSVPLSPYHKGPSASNALWTMTPNDVGLSRQGVQVKGSHEKQVPCLPSSFTWDEPSEAILFLAACR